MSDPKVNHVFAQGTFFFFFITIKPKVE